MRPLALALALALTGCLAPAPAPQAPAPAALLASLGELPCAAEVGEGTSANMERLGTTGALGAGWIGEADLRGDLALVARYSEGGFHVVDLADPAQPAVVASYHAPANALDVKWSPSGDAAYVGRFGSIDLVDMRDPLRPALVHRFRYADHGWNGGWQAHMLRPTLVEGREMLYVATQVNNAPALVVERVGWSLLPRGTMGSALPLVASLALGNHDFTIVDDPMRDPSSPTLYMAEGFGGWSAWDLADPAAPTRIGGSPSLEPGVGYLHTVRVAFLEGKRIVVTMSEVGQNTLKVYDATDLALPILLGRWNADAADPAAPQHNLQVLDGLLYMAHYAHGLYVFDLAAVAGALPVAGSVELAPIAHYQPLVDETDALGFGNVWDVLVDDGVVVLTHMSRGVETVRFGCLRAGATEQSRSD